MNTAPFNENQNLKNAFSEIAKSDKEQYIRV